MIDGTTVDLLGGLRAPIFQGRDARIATSASQTSESVRAREWRELEVELLGGDAASSARDVATNVASLGGTFSAPSGPR